MPRTVGSRLQRRWRALVAELLDDPGVAVHVALSVGRPVNAEGQPEAPQTALEATLDARPPSQPSGPSLRVPASLMRWMGLRPREETTPPPQKKSDDEDPAQALAEALDDVVVGSPVAAVAALLAAPAPRCRRAMCPLELQDQVPRVPWKTSIHKKRPTNAPRPRRQSLTARVATDNSSHDGDGP